ncbi:MAG: 50S ribosomal protein L20 [Candidatus Margulisbacteria bacterium]|jgi:large subunit ribosomal protein L20|nr:50S ribosomal protein L20 [Candidatus Margulisiibacteriota bacterium]
MSRVKRGNVARNRRKKILKLAKGFRASLSVLYRQAKPAVFRALSYQYRDRRRRKRDFRKLWIARINGALSTTTLNYSRFVSLVSKKDIRLNRKMLSELSIESPETFDELVRFVQS